MLKIFNDGMIIYFNVNALSSMSSIGEYEWRKMRKSLKSKGNKSMTQTDETST